MSPKRRDFLKIGGTLAAAAGLGIRPHEIGKDPEIVCGDRTADGPAGADDLVPQVAEITEATIAEAEKLHALEYTPEERRMLLGTIQGQIDSVEAVRQVDWPRHLQPGLIFDPRLPGVAYPDQPDRVLLSSREASPVPSDDDDIAYASVLSQSHWIRSGQLTSERLTNIYLDRIERLAGPLYCYITVTPELALSQARARDRELAAGTYRSPLHGIPYGMKDVIDTAGTPTTWGSLLYRDRVPDEDATVVTMLAEAGAVLLGKTATAELANGATWYGGTCRNPWNTAEAAGGSSTGSGSATAAGLCSFSIGTDSLGSILNPSDRCGVVGLRPTFGRVPVKGGMPLTPSLERIGPICRVVEDAALVLGAINGLDPTSAASIDMGFEYDGEVDVSRLTVGYSPSWFESDGLPGSASATSAAHLQSLDVLRSLGVRLVEIELPDLPYLSFIPNLYVEAAMVFEDLTLSGQDEVLGNQDAWPNPWRQARLLSAVDYMRTEQLRRLVMQNMHELFEQVDAVFGPTYGSFELVVLTNFTGHPGLTLRVGFAERPTRALGSLQPPGADETLHTITQNVAFHGPLFGEGKILALGRALEMELDVWQTRPPVG
jgi:Asp-tRNA(Asn)/Glu-tRNA(Gln) amidotransferase A subunit family amidase